MKLPKRWNFKLVSLIPRTGGLLLEIGAGNGSARNLLESLGYVWITLDIQKNKNISVVADAHNLPFRNRSIDVIVTIATLEHLYNPWKAVREMNRVLKKGGFLIGTVAFLEPYHGSYFHFTHLGLKYILKEQGFEILYLSPGWHAVESLNRGLLPLPLGYLWRVLAFLIMRLRRALIRILVSLRGEEFFHKSIKFLKEEGYRFAGSLIFKARKLDHSSES